MQKMFNFIRFSHSLKNLLIFFPVIVSGNLFLLQDYSKVLIGFTIFFLLTNLCYLINDYTDRDIDKLNKLKKTKVFLDAKNLFIYLFIYLLAISLVITSFDQQENFYIYIYLLNFIFYNFYFKKKKYLDLIFLTNFYLIRVFYGCQLFDISVSIGFIFFLFSFFLSLSIFKRLTQVTINNIRSYSEIIPYKIKDSKFMKTSIIYSIFINFLFFQFYVFFNLNLIKINYPLYFYSDYNLLSFIILDIIYIIFILRVIYALLKSSIKEDIYIFFIKDRLILGSSILIIILLIYEFIY